DDGENDEGDSAHSARHQDHQDCDPEQQELALILRSGRSNSYGVVEEPHHFEEGFHHCPPARQGSLSQAYHRLWTSTEDIRGLRVNGLLRQNSPFAKSPDFCCAAESEDEIGKILAWMVVGAVGTLAMATLGWHRGEAISAMWLVVAAVCSYALGYRFYAKFVAARVLTLDALRATPAERLENGRDFVR